MSTPRSAFAALLVGILAVSASWAGDVIVSWNPSADADGYKVYHGTSSQVYGTPVDVGSTTQTTLSSVPDCTNGYYATTAYNVAGESDFSLEVQSWPRPVLSGVSPSSAQRGTQATLTVNGVNFQSGDAVTFSNPGISVDGISVGGCNQATVTVTIGAGASLGAAEITVTHGSGVAGSAGGLFSVTEDAVAPTISSVNAGSIADVSANVTWTTDEASSSRVYYRVSGQSSYQQTALNATLVTSHAVALNGLQPGTSYDYHVESTDAAGNTATSVDSNFTTADGTGPQISGVQVNGIDGTSADVVWTTDEAATSRVHWRRAGQTLYQVTPEDAALVTGHQVTLEGLMPDTTYEYHVESADGSGNNSISADSTFTTGPSPFNYLAIEAEMGALTTPLRKTAGSDAFQGSWIDTPNGSGGGDAGNPLGTATYGFNVPNAGSWYLWVRLYAPGSQSASFFESIDGAARQSIAAPSNGTWRWVEGRSYTLGAGLHTLELGGEDRRARADRIVLTDDPSFVPTAGPDADVTPPAFVSNFSAQPAVGSNELSWDNPSNADFARTVIRYRTDGTHPQTPADGFPVTVSDAAPGSSGVFTHGGLDSAVTYHYSAFAVDDEGNVASPSQTQATPQGAGSAPAPPSGVQISRLLDFRFGPVAIPDEGAGDGAAASPRTAVLRRRPAHAPELAPPTA